MTVCGDEFDDFGQVWGEIDQAWANLARSCANSTNFARIWPIPARSRSIWGDSGQFWAEINQSRAKLDNFRTSSIKSGRCRSRPSRGDFGQSWSDIDHNCFFFQIGQLWGNLCQFLTRITNSGAMWSMSGICWQFCVSFGQFGQVWQILRR